MKFSELVYSRPDTGAVLAAYAALTQRVQAACSPSEITDVFAEHIKLDTDYSFMARLASIRYTIDTRDAFYTAEREHFDETDPTVGNAQLALYRALLESPFRSALAEKYGEILLTKMDLAVRSSDDRVLALQQEENRLVSEYQKLYASFMVHFDGKDLTLPQLGVYKQGPDRAVRKAAYVAEGEWFDAHRTEFDELYSKLVENRNAQAKALGYHDYSELSYLRMGRIGYGPAEVKNYREQVLCDVVPVVHELQKRRFARAGVPDAKFYDLPVFFADGNPKPHGTSGELLQRCRQMYHELSPETSKFIDWMFENECFDVLSKPGKAMGGYMEEISGYGPFVFSNWNGTSGDVDVITHEMGHAFQGYVAHKLGLVPELSCPGMESAEIHSMSMEFLTSPWHHLFFGPDTAKYQLMHAEDSLFFLPYGCIVDEFQHIVYQHPELTPEQRNQKWLELEKRYRPWVDFDGIPFYGRGAGWQRQLHIYEMAFYYIDYCLAQTVALQFFAAHLQNPADAWQRYLALVRKGGTESYAGLVQAAGFAVPFDSGSLKPVADTVAQWIREHQV
ncbi:MAG: M3 family oligoendopeptidase [Subdoligranulum sp.]|nr:M3 family oligoendopeptidase [Subdoligranulum sp.]